MGSSVNLEDITIKLQRSDAAFHKETIADLLHRHNTGFPGAQPVSFSRRHLKELEREDYFLAEKTDGIRCLLYLTQLTDPSGGTSEAQFLIDRKNDFYFIRPGYLHIPPPGHKEPFDINAWHLGTILDGELVRQRFRDGKEQLTYLIFDCLAMDNQSITERDYGVRIWKAENLVYKPWKAFAQKWPEDANAQPFQIQVKKPQAPYGAQMMFTDIIPSLPHGNDGLIFTCKLTPYVSGTDQHILKWKPPEENTVDFRVQLGAFPLEEDDEGAYEDFDQKPDIELLVYHGNNDYRKFANLDLTDEEWEAMKGMNEMFDWRIIECYRDAHTGHWRPKLDGRTPRFRDDKEHANHYTVVESVLESIKDAVSQNDLIDAAAGIRAAWKERERKRQEQEAATKRQQQEEHQRRKMEAQQQASRASAESAALALHEAQEESKPEENEFPRYE